MKNILTLILLGPVEIKWEKGQPPRFRSPTAVALLCYPVAENRPLARTLLTAHFWPDQAEEQARAELRRVLHNLSTPFAKRPCGQEFPTPLTDQHRIPAGPDE